MIFVDTHVHFYDCYDLKYFLDSAFYNFRYAKKAFKEPSSSVLLLTESGKLNFFSRFNDYATRQKKKYQFPKNLDFFKIEAVNSLNEAVRVFNKNGASLYIVAGRQIITKEKIEVLTLFSNTFFEKNSLAESVIQSVSDTGGIPVLPWSPGKWTGKRGQLIKGFIENKGASTIFLGDIFGRPSFYSEPLFQLAAKQNIRILAGSDPLPLKAEEKRVGCYMSAIPGKLDDSDPISHLKALLKNNKTKIVNYGQHIDIFNFIKNQILLRITKIK